MPFPRHFGFECFALTKRLPSEEKFGMVSQIRRAALSVHLNIAEGCSRKSDIERKRYYEMARGSVVEIDAVMDLAADLEYLRGIQTQNLATSIIDCFKTLCGMIGH